MTRKSETSCLCMIPAKAASKRLEKKNLLPLGGIPLVAHAILKAKALELIDHVCVSTESPEIAEIAERYGVAVPFLRPPNLSVDPTSVVDVCLHAISEYERDERIFDILVILHPSAPFVTMSDICEAFALFESRRATSLISVSEMTDTPFNAQVLLDDGYTLAPAFPESEFKFKKSTECPKSFKSNGAVCIASIPWLKETKSLYAGSPHAFVMAKEKSVDIDTSLDYEWAQYLLDKELVKLDSVCVQAEAVKQA